MIMPLLQWIMPNLASHKSSSRFPVWVGPLARYLENPTVAGETENTAPERIRDPPVLTRGRARSFAHTNPAPPFPVYWMDRLTLELRGVGHVSPSCG